MNQTDHTWDVQREVLHLTHESTAEYSEDYCLTPGKASAYAVHFGKKYIEKVQR